MRKEYPIIDISKLYCALLVMLIHVYEIRGTSIVGDTMIACLTQQAVPFFFIVSGFFLSTKLYDAIYIKSRIINLLLLYFVWVLLWSPSIISVYLERGSSLQNSILLIIRRILFAGEGVYWYLLVLAESIFIIRLLKNKDSFLLLLVVIGLSLGYLYDLNVIDAVRKPFYYVFSWSNNVIMKGLPFTVIGLLTGKYLRFQTINRTLLIFGYLLITLFDTIIYSFTAYGVLYPIQAYLLFLFSIQKSGIRFKTKLFREASSVVFFLHTVIIYYVVDPLFGKGIALLPRFLYTSLFVGLCFALIKLLNNKWINKIVAIS